MIKNEQGFVTPTLILGLLVLVYFVGFYFSYSGYGYPGHHYRHYRGSYFYWGGTRYFHGPSMRGGSVGGPNHSGGGFHGGK